MKSSIILMTAAALAVTACQRGPDNNAGQQGSQVPTGPAEQGQAAAGVRPAGAAAVQVARKEPFGEYLVDGEGRSLYVLEGSRQGEQGGTAAERSCTDACLGEWPPVITSGAPTGGEGIDAGQLSTVDRSEGRQVTYAGWPLYYYQGDRDPGSTSGQDIHDRWGGWYLLSPAGEHIEGGQ